MTQPTTEEVAGWLRELSQWFLQMSRLSQMDCTIDLNLHRAEMWANRADQVEAMGWRPIEEAPKDERILLWAEGWAGPNTGEWAKTGFAQNCYADEWMYQPTHFRPNVAPPAKK